MYRLTLASFAAIHSEVGGFTGFQATFLHTWSIHLHILRVAALSDVHLNFGQDKDAKALSTDTDITLTDTFCKCFASVSPLRPHGGTDTGTYNLTTVLK